MKCCAAEDVRAVVLHADLHPPLLNTRQLKLTSTLPPRLSPVGAAALTRRRQEVICLDIIGRANVTSFMSYSRSINGSTFSAHGYTCGACVRLQRRGGRLGSFRGSDRTRWPIIE